MKQLYTAVGRFNFGGKFQNNHCVSITVSQREYVLDLQEMILWSILNWKILTQDEIMESYCQKELQYGIESRRDPDRCFQRLVQRGLVAAGSGDTDADALYDLLANLFIIPITDNTAPRLMSFARLVLSGTVPRARWKLLLKNDRRSEKEMQVMYLANRAVLSASEIISCIARGILLSPTEDELLELLYSDAFTTCDNIAESTRQLPECWPVITSVANLYLRKQIVFDRM